VGTWTDGDLEQTEQTVPAKSILAETSNAERYETHFSAFDVYAKSGFFSALTE
jgi:hypothetical protein